MLDSFFVVVRHETGWASLETVTPPESIIGRSPESTLCLPDPNVSRCHAMLLRTSTKLLIRDLGSRNGTFLNGHRIKEVELRESDDIQINPYSLQVFFDYARAEKLIAADDDTAEPVILPRKEVVRMERELTRMQREVYHERLTGLFEWQIAERLGRKADTVHTHAKAIFKVFRVPSRSRLIVKCALRRK